MSQYVRERVRHAPRSCPCELDARATGRLDLRAHAPEERVRPRRPDRREQINVWLAEDRRPDPQQAGQEASRPFLLVILEPERGAPGGSPEPARTEIQPQK